MEIIAHVQVFGIQARCVPGVPFYWLVEGFNMFQWHAVTVRQVSRWAPSDPSGDLVPRPAPCRRFSAHVVSTERAPLGCSPRGESVVSKSIWLRAGVSWKGCEPVWVITIRIIWINMYSDLPLRFVRLFFQSCCIDPHSMSSTMWLNAVRLLYGSKMQMWPDRWQVW